ncbi:MAG: RecQ family zinc-binding domain-containing protein, partial [Spirochaetota bacterium]
AGRDGLPADCILFYSQDDLAVQIGFLEWKNPDAAFVRTAYDQMAKLGSSLIGMQYADLQEKIVHRNRGDHRLRTVLNLFDTHGITRGNIDMLNLHIVSPLPEEILSDVQIKEKMLRDRDRLIAMMNYAKTDSCRREYINRYFSAPESPCANCDNCEGAGD